MYDLIICRMHRLADSVKRVLFIVLLSSFYQHSFFKWNHLFNSWILIKKGVCLVISITYRFNDNGFGMMANTHIPPVTHCMGNCVRCELSSIIQFDMVMWLTCRKIENILNPSSAISQETVVNWYMIHFLDCRK